MPRTATRPSVAFVAFAILFASQSGLLVLSALLADVARDFDVSTATAGQLRTVCGLVAAVGALGLGLLARRVGLRRTLVAALVLMCVGATASAAAPSLAVLAMAQALVGLAAALLLGGGVAAAASWSAPEERARVLAVALLGNPGAWLVGMPLVGAVGEVSWRLSWIALPLAASLLALVAVLAVRAPDDAVSAPAGGTRAALRLPAVRRWAVGELLAFSAWGGTLVYVGALLMDSYATSPTLTGVILGIAAGAMMVGNMLARAAVERDPGAVLAAAGLAAAASVLALGTVRSGPWQTCLVISLLAFVCGGRSLAGSAFGLDAGREHQVAVNALRAAISNAGYLVGAAAGGIAVAAGGYGGLGVLLAVLFALGAAPHLAAPRRVGAVPALAPSTR